jgi:hypothetical protein
VCVCIPNLCDGGDEITNVEARQFRAAHFAQRESREVALHARGKESGRVTCIEQELGGSSHMGEPEFSDSTLRWMRMGDNIILCNGGIDTLDFHRAPNCLHKSEG